MKYIVCYILLFLQFQLLAQQTSLKFEQLPTDLGLTQGTVNTILQDHQGFLWIGTWSGLIKYDGYTTKFYKQSASHKNGLKSNKITSLFEDSQHRLWIGTRKGGFYQFDRNNENFIAYQHDLKNANSISNNNVRAIFEDSKGYLWIGTEGGLNRFDFDEKVFESFKYPPLEGDSIDLNFIYHITETPDKSLWISTKNGLFRMKIGGKTPQPKIQRCNLTPSSVAEHSEESALHNFIYRAIPSKQQANVLWVGTKAGLKKINWQADSFSKIDFQTFQHQRRNPKSLSHNYVSSIYEPSKYPNQLWVGTFNGFNVLQIEKEIFNNYFTTEETNSLNNNTIQSIYEDHAGVVWIGSDKGINKVNLHAKAFYSLQLEASTAFPNNNVVKSITSSQQSDGIWIGTRGGGLTYLNWSNTSPNSNASIEPILIPETPNFELANFVSELIIDQSGWLWVATQGAGLIKIKEADLLTQKSLEKNYLQYTIGNDEQSLSDNHVMSLCKSNNGNIWIGNWDGGLNLYESSTGSILHFLQTAEQEVALNAYPNVFLLETTEKNAPILWSGTRGNGVLKLRYDSTKQQLMLLQHFRHEEGNSKSLSNDFINLIFEDSQQNIWVGTEAGLNRFNINERSFTRYIEGENQLSNGIVQSMLEDHQGSFWISTQKGISRMLFSENQEVNIQNFDVKDGLQANFFNNNSTTKTTDGKLVFGGVNGITYFRPEEIRIDSILPKIALIDFKLFNQSVPIKSQATGKKQFTLAQNISETKSIELSHQQNVFTIEFAGLHFVHPDKNQYAYQLEGFDKEWIQTSAQQRSAHYTNLPYDTYTFKVKAANSDGIWGKEIASLQLKVNPPFWLTTWAYILYLCLFLAVLYGVRKVTLMRVNLQNKLKIAQLEQEKSEEVNQLKMQFFTNISHELRTPLTLIISPLEQMMKGREGDRNQQGVFTRMYQNANKLLTMINQLLDIRKSEAGLMHLQASKSNIVLFVREIVLSFKTLAQQQNIELQFETSHEQIPLWFDHDLMEKVFYNLLSNAFKFTSSNGQIHIQLMFDETQQLVNIEVSDTGIGIPSEQLAHIFDRFYQVENAQNIHGQQGTGIGLALVKDIIQKHQGNISVESELQKGTRFSFQLPFGNQHFEPNELVPNHKDSEHPDHYSVTIAPVQHSESAAPKTSKKESERKTVLIVEDNADIRAYLRENLRNHYQIEEAENGKMGLEKALENSPDLIISDISMPEMDGLELCQQIKSNILTSHIPVILLTARTSLVFKIDGLETGADDYITKPFNMQLLQLRIKNLFEARRKWQEKFTKNFDLNPSEVVVHSLDEELLNNIKKTVEENIDNADFSVEELAKLLFMSRMQLYRKIKALTGKSPNRIIRSIRLKRAAQLIETHQYRISDVTYMVGYNDLRSFREQFKKEFGVTPSQYGS